MKSKTFHGADGSPYLTRTELLRLPFGFRLYRHRFHRADEGEEFHDHPWGFVTLVLKGGYVERYLVKDGGGRTERERVMGPGRFGYRPRTHIHRVDRLLGSDVVTLVLTGPKTGEWGFWRKVPHQSLYEFVHWRVFLMSKGLNALNPERGEPEDMEDSRQ